MLGTYYSCITGHEQVTDNLCRLEERRKVKGAAYYERKRKIIRAQAEAKKTAGSEEQKKQLAELGY